MKIMKKYLIIILGLCACSNACADYDFWKLFEDEQAFAAFLQEYKNCMAGIVPHLSETSRKTYGVWTTNTPITIMDKFPSQAVFDKFSDYRKLEKVLDNQVIARSADIGVMAGVALGVASKLLNQELVDNKTVWAGIAAAIGIVLYKNYRAEPIAYLAFPSNGNLQQHDNLFKNVGLSVACVVCNLGSIGLGYVASRYTTAKVAYWYNCYQGNLKKS